MNNKKLDKYVIAKILGENQNVCTHEDACGCSFDAIVAAFGAEFEGIKDFEALVEQY